MNTRIEHLTIVGWVPCPLTWGDMCVRIIPIAHREIEIRNGVKHILIEMEP
jgi:hypothetical protein